MWTVFDDAPPNETDFFLESDRRGGVASLNENAFFLGNKRSDMVAWNC